MKLSAQTLRELCFLLCFHNSIPEKKIKSVIAVIVSMMAIVMGGSVEPFSKNILANALRHYFHTQVSIDVVKH